jgi:hypothetical protein
METVRPKELWDAIDMLGREFSVDPTYVLDPIGLLLVRPLERWDYDVTLLNSLTLAHTGGDGVHFGFLLLNRGNLDTAPVVMTGPGMWDAPNLVRMIGLSGAR